jgi:hypothetical protein
MRWHFGHSRRLASRSASAARVDVRDEGP